MSRFNVGRHESVFDPRSVDDTWAETRQTDRQTDVYVNINQTVHPLTALLDLYFRPRLFDLLDHTAHEFIDLLQGSGGTEWAEELDALTGCQQLYSQN